ncbi:hypothetical protein [Streptomyces sp. NPDC058664]|uniref:hypothetical protein n=1 Tax=unclassified Streptomyces TaxID=2593676 RepID=UPI003658E768
MKIITGYEGRLAALAASLVVAAGALVATVATPATAQMCGMGTNTVGPVYYRNCSTTSAKMVSAFIQESINGTTYSSKSMVCVPSNSSKYVDSVYNDGYNYRRIVYWDAMEYGTGGTSC